MKLKTLKLCFIPICILICTVLAIYLFYYIYNSNNGANKINKFEDTPATSETTAPIVTAMSIPTEELVETCNESNNIVGFCMNYKGCCSQEISSGENKKCFCEHPFLQDCKKAHEECKQTSSDKTECNNKLKECCTSYNKINIDISNFEKPIKQDQVSQKLCAIGTINGLSTDNMRLKCMELCQTNTNCKAFSIDDVSCILFSDVNPLPTKAPNKPKTLTDYYIKK